MKLAYVDSCVWITLIEGLEPYRPAIHDTLAGLARDGWELCTSDAVRLEVLIRPIRLKDEMLIGIYRAVLDTNRALAVSPSVFAEALDRAVRDGLKAMDAVHVTIAERHGCQRFVTTDPHFRSLTSIIPELIALPGG
jgi:predicted nucleic acid-binding protein